VAVVEVQCRGPPHAHAKQVSNSIIIEDEDEVAEDLDGTCHPVTGLNIMPLPLKNKHIPIPLHGQHCSDMPILVSDSDGSVDDLLVCVPSAAMMPAQNTAVVQDCCLGLEEPSDAEPTTSEISVSSCSGSSDSEPVSRKARKYLARLQAKRNKPSAGDGLTATFGQLTSCAPGVLDDDALADLLNLWTAQPPSDKATRHDSDADSVRSSRCG
jgi:hypothetical protein